MHSVEIIKANILSGKPCFCLKYYRRYDCFNFPYPYFWRQKFCLDLWIWTRFAHLLAG